MSFTERRTTKRVADAMAICIETTSTSQPSTPARTTRVVKLSTHGMRFTYGSKLPDDETLQLSMLLGPERKEVCVCAEVATCTENAGATPDARYATRLIFKDLDTRTRQLLEQHIDHVYQQTRVLKELPFKQSA
jgi:hypothetical protein